MGKDRYTFEVPAGAKKGMVYIMFEYTTFVTEVKTVKGIKERERVGKIGTRMRTLKRVNFIEDAINKLKKMNTKKILAAAWIGHVGSGELKPHMIIESGVFINQSKP